MTRAGFLGQLELMVLLAAMHLGDGAYGVAISRAIEARSGRRVSLAGVYAALEGLEARKLVSSRRGVPTTERGGKARVYFTPTSAGRREVRETWDTLLGLQGNGSAWSGAGRADASRA